jgi:Tol biopolymer transport system component
VFESSASNLVTGDTNNASDIFVTNGTTVTRLSVSATGVQGSDGANSYDPTICASGRKVVFTTDNEWDATDANGAEDVYVIDRDADADGVFDEFTQSGSVTTSLVSQSYNADSGEFDISYFGAQSGVISDDCTKVAFVSDMEFNLEDINFGPDVYVRDLTGPTTPVSWATQFATNGAIGGGYLPAISADGSTVVVSTEATDLVSDSGTASGLVMRRAGVGTYLTRTPAGVASTSALADSERPSAITPDGKCVAFKADRGYDLLAGNAGAAQGIYLWDNRTGTPVISLVSKDSVGVAATSAANPRISDDCRFVAYQSSDEDLRFDVDDNKKIDVFLYDTIENTTDIISTNAAGASADGDSGVAALDWDEDTGLGVVIITSSASNIRGAAGGNSTIDLFSVPFTAEVSTAGGLTALSAPVRLLDTRGSGNKVGKTDGTGTPYELTVAGVSGVPSTGVAAVAMNVTVVDGEATDVGGYVTVYPCGTRPDSSNLNFVNGQTVPNAVIASASAAGKVCFYVYGKAHLLVDVAGYFS